MSDHQKDQTPSRYGLRLEDLSADELAYYRAYLPPEAQPAPANSQAPEPAQHPQVSPRPKTRNRWYWLPHSLTLLALALAVASFLLVPALTSHLDPNLQRNYAMMVAELAFFFLVFAALLYGIFALSHLGGGEAEDEADDRLMRPTDFAQQLYQKELDKARPGDPQDFYDSSWIQGKK